MTEPEGPDHISAIDIHAVANQLVLDQLAIRASAVLHERGIPHALIKGVTTARWLYDPPRDYRDVDLLVPASRLPEAVRALRDAGVVQSSGGRLGEEASHSQVLIAKGGRELDLHFTLPTMPTPVGPHADEVWEALAGHLVDFKIDHHSVPALDLAGRTLVLAMHCVAGGYASDQVLTDYRRARRAVDEISWQTTQRLADQLGVSAELRAVEALTSGQDWRRDAPARVRLRLGGASAVAIQLQALAEATPWRRPILLAREALPTPAMLRRQHPGSSNLALPLHYLRRWIWLSRALPRGISQLRQARRDG